ncbi:hypothetical protein D5018_03255 [Parashewanella curva]|uniref:Uncharacterized protein n=1 Tax=Parashewanella curva TaxID=2338552 RepID=A0A3L8Q097_9GAMM|nr:hypothetical protein [Parashewanella curva]RLV61126.1 hypothetical protein D5018_03255 [Parashewanella curva]
MAFKIDKPIDQVLEFSPEPKEMHHQSSLVQGFNVDANKPAKTMQSSRVNKSSATGNDLEDFFAKKDKSRNVSTSKSKVNQEFAAVAGCMTPEEIEAKQKQEKIESAPRYFSRTSEACYSTRATMKNRK